MESAEENGLFLLWKAIFTRITIALCIVSSREIHCISAFQITKFESKSAMWKFEQKRMRYNVLYLLFQLFLNQISIIIQIYIYIVFFVRNYLYIQWIVVKIWFTSLKKINKCLIVIKNSPVDIKFSERYYSLLEFKLYEFFTCIRFLFMNKHVL